MNSSPVLQQDRIDTLVPHEVYRTLARAAELTGASVDQFLVQSALKEARAVIEHDERFIRLSGTDWTWLLDLIDHPPPFNARLEAAFERYHQARRDDADCAFDWRP